MKPVRVIGCVAVGALFVMRCDTTYDIGVVPFLDDGGFRGFQCVDDAGQPLVARMGSSTQFVTVMDVLDFGPNVLSCRTNALLDYCKQSHCEVIDRICATVEVADASTFTAALKQTFDQLRKSDAAIVGLPTDTQLMIRVVSTTESAAAACPKPGVFPTLDTSSLLGCAYSCPARLDQSGTVQVQLDSFSSTQCGTEVAICATVETL